MAVSEGAWCPRNWMHRKPSGLGSLKMPSQRHCTQPICPKLLGLFLAHFFLLLRKDQNTSLPLLSPLSFFFSVFQTLFIMPVFQRTLKCFIFIPSENKDILQWLEILLWSRMIIFHLAFGMLSKASRRIHVRLQISSGYSENAATVVGLLGQPICVTFSTHLVSNVVPIQWGISKPKYLTQGITVNEHFYNPLQRLFMREAGHSW